MKYIVIFLLLLISAPCYSQAVQDNTNENNQYYLSENTTPIFAGIEKSSLQSIVLDNGLVHLGDDNFSDASANSNEFHIKSVGPFYSKMFIVPQESKTKSNYLFIGSVIGVDTLMARNLKQNTITNSYSSPPEIYLNGTKISEIQLNGNGQRIKLPNNVLKIGTNEITIKTGRNMQRTDYTDYDDIELIDISIQTE